MLHVLKIVNQRKRFEYNLFPGFFLHTFASQIFYQMEEKLVNIINKASAMFVEYGIRSVSMDDICQKMGMSKKTLYQYVSNKSDLLEF